MEYIGNEDTLEEASHIKELKTDAEFLNMLYKRFHENVLKNFGYKSPEAPQEQYQPSSQLSQTPQVAQQQAPQIPQVPYYEPR